MSFITASGRCKAALAGVALLAVAACGDDDDGGIFGTESALSCVETTDVSGGVDVTNTCDSNIIVLTNSGERLVIPPDATNRLVTSGGFFSIAACFSPNEPEFDGSTSFTCG